MELKRRNMNVLRKLAENPTKIFFDYEIPDGNGMVGRVSRSTLREIHIEGLVNRNSDPWSSVYGYCITADGIKAVEGKS